MSPERLAQIPHNPIAQPVSTDSKVIYAFLSSSLVLFRRTPEPKGSAVAMQMRARSARPRLMREVSKPRVSDPSCMLNPADRYQRSFACNVS